MNHFVFFRHFAEVNNRAIDEVWYRRAVEQHFVDENSFVFSVPFEGLLLFRLKLSRLHKITVLPNS